MVFPFSITAASFILRLYSGASMPSVIDLHSHSNCSDGEFTPALLVEEAHSRGVTTLALTDHDTVAGLDEAEAAATRLGIEFVPGVEFTVGCNGVEVHMLGLGVDRTNRVLLSLCDEIQGRRRARFFGMVERLRMMGVPLNTQGVEDGVSLARPYLARMLVQQEYTKTYQEAFEKYLHKNGPAFVPHNQVDITRAIDAVHDAGGVAVLAHPGLYKESDKVIHDARNRGVDGIECIHSDHNHNKTSHFLAKARKLEMLVSGGADFHGPDHARSKMFGKRSCPPEEFARLMDAINGGRGALNTPA
jgi:3',5'-nucleoside bisphosphate phosphatase